MKINEAKDYIKKIVVDLSEFYDGEKEFIELREPTVLEQSKFEQIAKDDDKEMKAFMDFYPKLIVDHSFVKEDGEKASSTEVAKVLNERITIVRGISEAIIELLTPKKKMTTT